MAVQERSAGGRAASSGAWAGKGDHQMLDFVLRRDMIRAVYQPIIDLSTNRVAAYEALARGPEGTPMESPGALFGAAIRCGRLRELEWACRGAAIQGALDMKLGTQISLFVNVEPGVVGGGTPPAMEQLLRVAERRLRIVLELTERDLCHRPVDLLRLVAWARQRWWGIALDDVGADETSLALLPLVEPDVVKLDKELVQNQLTDAGTSIVRAVQEYCRRTGATLLAEGIENDDHLAHAQQLGASLGQGWAFGRPGDLEPPKQSSPVRLLAPPPPPRSKTPWEALALGESVQHTNRQGMIDAMGEVAQRAVALARPSLVLGGTGDVGVNRVVLDHCAALAPTATAVIALGLNAEGSPVEGVRCVDLDPGTPVQRERTLIVITPDHSMAVTARGPGTTPNLPDDDVELVVSHERATVLTAARLLFAAAIDRTA